MRESVSDAHGNAGSDVEHASEARTLEQSHVRLDDIVDVHEFATRFEIADAQGPSFDTTFASNDFTREEGHGETRSAARPHMVERPRDDDVEIEVFGVTPRHVFDGDLLYAVGMGASARSRFRKRKRGRGRTS
jgi:hypothetical protein